MIRLENASKAYGQKNLFKDLFLCINDNDKCGFIGRNGSGKTTLFRLITKKESLDSGNIIISNDYTFGYLDQHIKFTKKSVLEEAITTLKCAEWEKEYKAEIVLFGLGFNKEDMKKDPMQFSGGYQLRIHLAKVLLSEPSCLLLDEPTNYLDIISINWLKKFLKLWKGAFIIISHDRDFLDSVSNHTIGLHRGEIYKVNGKTNDFFNLILKKEIEYQANLKNIEKKRAHLQSFINRFGAKATKASQAKSKKKALEKIPAIEELLQIHSLKFSFNEAPFYGNKLIDIKALSFSYPSIKKINSEKDLIKNLSISIEKGEKIAVIGKNGYGKSTILKLLSKELIPTSGSIIISEKASIGYFGQTNINRLNLSNTIIEEISKANPLLSYGEIRRLCGIMLFTKDDAEKRISVLSGGEKSRVLLGKILAKPCNILLLDEPTNHLDIESIESLLNALKTFKGALVIVTHSELILEKLSLDKLIICEQDKQTVFLGNYKSFLEKKGWEEDSSNISSKKKNIIKSCKNNHHQNSKNLKKMKKELNILEKEIIDLEKIKLSEEKALIKASQKGDKEKIVTLSKSIKLIQNKIDNLFIKLEELTNKYEDMKKL